MFSPWEYEIDTNYAEIRGLLDYLVEECCAEGGGSPAGII
jgi:hypothetical protein